MLRSRVDWYGRMLPNCSYDLFFTKHRINVIANACQRRLIGNITIARRESLGLWDERELAPTS